MTPAPPLRFLALAVGGWICVRAAILAPGWSPQWDEAKAPPPSHNGAAALASASVPATTAPTATAPTNG